jgi:lipopolysaccharide/colanic/teichoic acid biosynthesis glycosyltransferase
MQTQPACNESKPVWGTHIAQGFYAKHGKRALDIFAAAAGLLILVPAFAIIAVTIKLESPGPVFFRQTRIGRAGRPFNIWKFRSMSKQSLQNHSTITVAGDNRITTIGRFVRRFKLDELPQLWNVLRGDMSLVGPRPEVPIYVAQYTPEERTVLSARPGITDPSSLAYRHEEELLATHDDPESFYRTRILPDKLARSRNYLRNITLYSDLRIILETLSLSFFTKK